MKLTQNEATRFVNIIDGRIKRALGRGTVLEITYGDVDSIDGRYCDVTIGGDTNPSGGFRIPSGMRLQVGDRVRVAIDPRGDRYIQEVIHTTAYPKILFDPLRGDVYSGDGSSDPTTMLYQDGPRKVNTDGGIYAGDDSLIDANLEVTVDLEVHGGDLHVGVDGTTNGFVHVYGAGADEGGEVILYGAASHDDLHIDNYAGRLRVHNGAVVPLDVSTTRLNVSAGDLITFGTAEDTNLYRDSANILRTDDSFRVGDPTGGSGVDISTGGNIELSHNGGNPFIDFKNAPGDDFDARLIYNLSGSGKMEYYGANFRFNPDVEVSGALNVIGALLINGSPLTQLAGLRIQRGQVTTTHSASNVSAVVTVTFPVAFSGAPQVILTSLNYNYLAASNGVAPSATQFNVATKRIDGSAPTGSNVSDWIAIGPA